MCRHERGDEDGDGDEISFETFFNGIIWEIFELQSISLKMSVTYVCEDEKLACFGLQLTSV